MCGIMKRIIIQLEEETLADLDEAAREVSESRAAYARRAIEVALGERLRSKELRLAADSFRKKPPEDLTASEAAIRRAWPS